MANSKSPCGCGGVSSVRSDLGGVAASVNGSCHGFVGGVSGHQKHVVPKPQVVLIYWDQYFTDTAAAVTSMDQFVSDLATGGYWSGLRQYGVGAAGLSGHAVINMTKYPTPNSQNPGKPFSESQLQAQLVQWLNDGAVTPKPAGNEENIVYLIFSPTDTTLSLGGNTSGFCGYHQHGNYNATTSRANLIWGTVRGYTKAVGAQAGQNFVDSISFCVSHELSEAFSNTDGNGYYNDSNGCEIGDICEANATGGCCITVPYVVSGRTWKVERYWSNLDSTCISGASSWLPRAATPLDGYATTWNNQQHVNYVAGDGSVHELVYKDSPGWGNTGLTGVTSTPPATTPLPSADSPLDGYATTWNDQQHVNYIGQDRHVHEFVYKDSGGWSHSDLSQAAAGSGGTGANSLPRQGSPIDGYATPWNNQQHVNYIGQDGHVHELVYKDSGGWSHGDLSQAAAGSGGTSASNLPQQGSPIDGFATPWNSQQHLNYIGQNGHVHELVFKSNAWSHGDLSQAAAGSGGTSANSLPRQGSPADGYATPWNSQQHVNYIGQDGHVHELVYKDSGGWSHSDLNQSALANN